ncbi:MAG TPA: ATP synthase F1 subunit delta [Candidatus Acidoferrales bacterium]|nr:ATP synthase F1 subunit delta [Candidatus Acidoferrales bacterium]
MKALAQRYAAALVDVAMERGQPEQTKEELANFVRVFGESADLRNFLASPAIPRPSKQAVIEKLVAHMKASQTVRNFLFVLVQHHRSHLLTEIQQAFEEMLRARLGVAEAQVTSAEELTRKQKSELMSVLEGLTGKRIEARYDLEPGLIAGAVVRIGSTIYDGSVREQLDRLRARLASE